ncbi:MAG TPA: nucleotidyltransferase domain-containing protein [Candidatus Avamphibacillus sp.]|nr:nucleotidyltransferase domain-containing protein [Candidatus Avamphibacillus sp.]
MGLNLSKTGISHRFMEELLAYCAENNLIEKVVLFGSRTRGDFRPASDIDLAIRTSSDASHSKQNLIAADIEEMNTPLKLDISFFNRLTKQSFISNIKEEGVVVYEQRKNLREVKRL